MSYFGIYRMPSTTPTTTHPTAANIKTSTYADKIVFTEGSVGMVSHDIRIGRFNAAQPAPFSEEVTKQDPGFEGLTATITLAFTEESARSAAINRLKTWALERNTVKTVYRHGRIGIWNDWQSEYDLHPSAAAGYKLVNFSCPHYLEWPTVRIGTITLEFSGSPNLLGS